MSEEVKPLVAALEGSGFQPILLHGDSGSELYDATGRISANLLGGNPWDAQIDSPIDGGRFILVKPTPDPKLSQAQQQLHQASNHQEVGWLDARTGASFHQCQFGSDTLSIGARW